MKKYLFVLVLLLMANFSFAQPIIPTVAKMDITDIFKCEGVFKAPRYFSTKYPSLDSSGMFWYDTTTHTMWYHNGTTRVNIGSGGGGGGGVSSVSAGAGLAGGTITSSGTISMPNVGTAGTKGTVSAIPVFTTDAQGRVSASTNTPVAAYVANGGTGLFSLTLGDIMTYNTSNSTTSLTAVHIGSQGNALLVSGDVPVWGDVYQLALVTKYNGLTTAGYGIAPIASNDDVVDKNNTYSFPVTTVPVGGNFTYRFGLYITINNIAGSSLNASISYIDENSNSRNLALIPVGQVAPAMTSTGVYFFPYIPIRAHGSTSIIVTVGSSGGTVGFDAGRSLEIIAN